MRDVFIADAHLRAPADENYRRLLEFLAQQESSIRTLYLLGDIFEFWVGYRHVVFAPYVPLLEALRRLREHGVEIVYAEGNHDFHMGPYFEKVLGCTVLPDGAALEIDGVRVYIAHGDLVNSADRRYRLLRGALRCRPVRLLMTVVPPDWTWGIARWASLQSRRKHGAESRCRVPEALLDEHGRRRFAEGAEAVVTGHYHAPWLRRTDQGTIVSLGDWITQYSYAVFENGTFSLHSW